MYVIEPKTVAKLTNIRNETDDCGNNGSSTEPGSALNSNKEGRSKVTLDIQNLCGND